MARKFSELRARISPEARARVEARVQALEAIAACDHDWQEQPGEPPRDVCSQCGAVRE